MLSRRKTFLLLTVVCAAAPFVGSLQAGGEGPAPVPVHYQPPVAGRVVDPFRPPATPFGPGNRGIDFATRPGDAVRAAGPGTVIFAGQVGGVLDVVLLHGDNLRTS